MATSAPRDKGKPPEKGARKKPAFARVLIISTSPSPTLDYYLAAVASRAGGARIDICDASKPCKELRKLEPETWAVVFRSVHPSWLHALLGQQNKLARVTWLIDDDLPAIIREGSLPALYAWRTHLRYLRMRGLMRKLAADHAFSTEELASRYPALGAEVWPPRQFRTARQEDLLTYCYHGTASHRAELAWLAPIVAEVQRQVPEAWFEVFADTRAREFYRGIPRVRCLYPMNWPDYLAHTSSFRRDVGLAPLLDTPFNRARAPVKFFDITRTGAAGIYSAGATYDGTVKHDVNGLLLPNEPKQWVDAILRLLRSPAERSRLAAQAARECSESKQD